ncbi:hypothetical protein BGX20_000459 [Mortierella sp. AD010]|nr:hypothetical protein BGX20_000459 [Mortierella sp. AD010]
MPFATSNKAKNGLKTSFHASKGGSRAMSAVDDARDIARTALYKRIDSQISATGAQPEEMARKTSWYYSVFNLQALMTLAR